MKEDNWNKLEKAFHYASQLEPAQLELYLEKIKLDAPEISNELSDLLEQDNDFVNDSNEGNSGSAIRADKDYENHKHHSDTVLGTEIGAFKVLNKIAHGGMSTVYKAERINQDFTQQAAIKILSQQFLSPESLESFNFERRTLASFDHPNIAKVLDGGTTKDGLPYLTMEYINGIPIDQFCLQQELSLTQIIELFLQLTNAVEFAHNRLVVHRDIKPSNVLVTTDGLVKLLDFGISKSMELEQQREQLTTLGSRPMTPAFASPEQISGQPITVATDIYSLGVLLYKLITHKMPYANTSSLQLIYAICKEQPSSPSQSIYTSWKELTEKPRLPKDDKPDNSDSTSLSLNTPGDLKRMHRSIKGDLDNIVLHSLNKKPESRYPSVRELSNDLNRYLNGQAVYARGNSSLYKFKKWIGRNKAASTLALTLLLSYTGFTSYSIWQANQLKIESRTAQTVSDYLVNLFTVVNISQPQTEIKPNKEMTVIELLDAGKEFIMQDLADQPKVKVRLLNSMADAYQGMGDYKNAEKLIDETIKLQQSLNVSDILLADSLNISGWNKYSSGKYRQALLSFSKALSLDIDKPTYYQSLHNVATAQTALAQFEQAKQNYEKVIEYNNSLTNQNEAKNAAALHNYAILLWELGEFKRAKEIELQVLDIYVRNYGEESSHASDAYNFLGTLSKSIDKDIAKALEYYSKSLQIDRSLYPGHHQSVGYGLLDIGSLYFELGNYQLALESFEEARDVFAALFGEDNLEVGNALNSIADVYFDYGEINKALQLYQQALVIYHKNNSTTNPSKSIVIENLAQSQFELFQHESAINLIKSDFKELSNILPAKHPQVRSLHTTLSGFYLRLGNTDLANRHLSKINNELVDSDGNITMLTTHEISLALVYWQVVGNQPLATRYLKTLKERLKDKKLVSFFVISNLILFAEKSVSENQPKQLVEILPEIESYINSLGLQTSLLSLRYHLVLSQLGQHNQTILDSIESTQNRMRTAREISSQLDFDDAFIDRLIQPINQNNTNN